MARKRDGTKPFYFYRAQFYNVGEAVTLDSDLTALLQVALEKSVSLGNRTWVAGDFARVLSGESVLLYGKVGRLEQERRERFLFDSLHFVEKEDQTSDSVAFVFEQGHEYVAVEQSTYPARTVARRIERIFNSAPALIRRNRLLRLYELSDTVSAYQRLKALKHLKVFKAELRRPNPDSRPEWEELWKTLSNDTDVDKTKVSWISDRSDLKIKPGNAVEKAILMSNAGYGDWDAKDSNGAHVKSSETALHIQLPVDNQQNTIEAAIAVFQDLPERLERKE